MIWVLAIILFIISLFFLRIKVKVIYNETLTVTAGILFLKFKLIPAKEKKEKPVKTKEVIPKKIEVKKEKKKSDPLEAITLIKNIITKIIEQFNKYLVVEIKELHIKVASDDAAKTALLYGAVSQSVVYLLEKINQNVKKVKTKSVAVVSDFIGSEFDARIKIIFKLRVWQALLIVLKTAIEYIKTTKIKNNSEV